MSDSVLDRLVGSLNGALEFNANAVIPPIALLWPDERRQWESVIVRFSELQPILTLGDYDVASGSGPAYWIRCVIAGTVEARLLHGTPIVYLPGVARSDLRAADSCPPELAPIAELQYRSQWFSHPNSKDWSVRALLTHPGRGLGLQVADDAKCAEALALALDQLLDEPADGLTKFLDADFFNDLVNPDPMSSLLGWLNDPAGFRSRVGEARWAAFIGQCKADFGFDPLHDGEITAARKLGERSGIWGHAWRNFADTPARYPGIPDQLRRARPQELLVENLDVWPQDNENLEDQLRASLRDLQAATAEGARSDVRRFDAGHSWRRGTVWADLGWAPLAFALEQLVAVAELTAHPLPSDNLDALVADYADRGYKADDAIIRALAAVPATPDRDAVVAAAQRMYQPWVDAGAKAMQTMIGPMAHAQTYEAASRVTATPGVVTVFVDGLRLDIANQVAERLTSRGLRVEGSTMLAALPTVTQTAKAAMVPVAEGALAAGADLDAANAVTGTKATIQVLRALMKDQGVQISGPTESGDPSGMAWAEAGEIDSRGHDQGVRLVDYLDDEVARIVARIGDLLEAGWERVEIVTDHGWILLPDEMEKVSLPTAVVEVRKGRCARLKVGTVVPVPTVPWYWDPDVRIALAPGATCFEAGKAYEHGGVSPQECIVARLAIAPGIATPAAHGPEITKVKWLGLLCRVELSGAGDGVLADIRGMAADPKTSIAEEAQETTGASKVALVVSDEEHEGERAHLVLVGSDGAILAQRDVVVGRNR